MTFKDGIKGNLVSALTSYETPNAVVREGDGESAAAWTIKTFVVKWGSLQIKLLLLLLVSLYIRIHFNTRLFVRLNLMCGGLENSWSDPNLQFLRSNQSFTV